MYLFSITLEVRRVVCIFIAIISSCFIISRIFEGLGKLHCAPNELSKSVRAWKLLRISVTDGFEAIASCGLLLWDTNSYCNCFQNFKILQYRNSPQILQYYWNVFELLQHYCIILYNAINCNYPKMLQYYCKFLNLLQYVAKYWAPAQGVTLRN